MESLQGSESEGGLTVAQLLAVSKRVSTEGQLWTLASGGLGLAHHHTQTALTNHPNDIQGAAHAVLRVWFQGQPDQKETLKNLVTALNQCGMKSIATELEQPKEGNSRITTERLNDIERWLRGSMQSRLFSSLPGKDWTMKSVKTELKQVYTPPSLVRLERGPHKVERQPLEDIPTLLRDIQATDPQGPVRILVQAPGGMGKSTLLKHLALTWADGSSEDLNKFKLVFHLALNQVKDGSTIEEIIIAQHRGLKANRVQPDEIRSILDGDYKVLLLLDGHDEYKQGRNKNIDAAIKREHVWNCWMITTSRDSDLKDYMDAEVEIHGFQGNEVMSFINKVLTDSQKTKQLLEEAVLKGLCAVNSEGDFDFTGSLLTTPFLLNMVCFLFVYNRTLPRTRTGIIDAIVSRCVDRESIRAKGQKAVDSAKQALVKLGELAWLGLKQGRYFFEKNMVPAEVLELGILVGADNFVQQEEEEEMVWFQHLMLQQFVAGKYIADLTKAELEALFPTINHIMQHFDVVLFAFGFCDQPSTLSQVLFDILPNKSLTYSWEAITSLLLKLQAGMTEDSKLNVFHNKSFNYTTKDSPLLCVPSKLYRFDDNTPDRANTKVDKAALVGVEPAECVIEVSNKKSLLNVLNILIEIQRHQKVYVQDFKYSPRLAEPPGPPEPPGYPGFYDDDTDHGIALLWADAFRHGQKMSSFMMRGRSLSVRIHRVVFKHLMNCEQLIGLHLEEMSLQSSLNDAVAKMKHLKFVNISYYGQIEKVNQALMVALKNCVDLEHAVFNGNVMTQRLESFLGGTCHTGFPRLVTLTLENTGLIKEDLSTIAQAARNRKFPNLKNLDLARNRLTECLHMLFPDDPHPGYPQLENLGLSNTSVSKSDVVHLMAASKNGKLPRIVRLLLDSNNLRGCFTGLPDHSEPIFSQLVQLDVSNCDLEKSDLEDISRVFASCRILRFNNNILTGTVQGLFDGRGLPSAESLELQNTHLNGKDLVSLTQAIKSSKLPHLKQLLLFYDNFQGSEHLVYDLFRTCVEARRKNLLTIGMCLNDFSNSTESMNKAKQICTASNVAAIFYQVSYVGGNRFRMKLYAIFSIDPSLGWVPLPGPDEFMKESLIRPPPSYLSGLSEEASNLLGHRFHAVQNNRHAEH